MFSAMSGVCFMQLLHYTLDISLHSPCVGFLRSTTSGAGATGPTCKALRSVASGASSPSSTTDSRSEAVWPSYYELPPFLQMALEQQDPSFKKMGKSPERASLVQVPFDNITAYTW